MRLEALALTHLFNETFLKKHITKFTESIDGKVLYKKKFEDLTSPSYEETYLQIVSEEERFIKSKLNVIMIGIAIIVAGIALITNGDVLTYAVIAILTATALGMLRFFVASMYNDYVRVTTMSAMNLMIKDFGLMNLTILSNNQQLNVQQNNKAKDYSELLAWLKKFHYDVWIQHRDRNINHDPNYVDYTNKDSGFS